MVTGLPEDTAAHKGMSMGAAKMLKRLLPVLDRAFAQFPHYDLVLTGNYIIFYYTRCRWGSLIYLKYLRDFSC